MPFDRLFDGGYYLDPSPGIPSTTYAVIGVLYLLLLVVSLLAFRYRVRLGSGEALKTSFLARFATIGMLVGAAGVVLVAMRYLQLPVLSARLWVVLLVLVSLALAGYLLYFLAVLYPARRSRLHAEELRHRYPPRPKGKPAAAPSRVVHARKKGKRHR